MVRNIEFNQYRLKSPSCQFRPGVRSQMSRTRWPLLLIALATDPVPDRRAQLHEGEGVDLEQADVLGELVLPSTLRTSAERSSGHPAGMTSGRHTPRLHGDTATT